MLILLYSGPLATAFANWASQSITRSLGPLTSAMGFLATPVVGLVAGALILGESLGLIDIVGFALVLGGIAAASLVPPKTAARGRHGERARLGLAGDPRAAAAHDLLHLGPGGHRRVARGCHREGPVRRAVLDCRLWAQALEEAEDQPRGE